MEPVVLPKAISPVTRTDRVKRAQPREDSGGGSAFARYLRQKKEDPADAPARPAEDAKETSDPVAPENPAEPHGQPSPKRVDIRV
jgi:hypothetical protein